MTSGEYINFLLSNIPSAKPASGNKEINCRCFECADSINPNHGHLYIKIPQNEDDLSFYECKKCLCKGIVTHKKLIEWGIYNDDIGIKLIHHNNTALKSKKNISISNRNVYYTRSNYITHDNISDCKLKYINNRLGINLTYDDLVDLKICLNLNDILNTNPSCIRSRDDRVIDALDKNFIGFISIDNAFINMRRIIKEGILYKSIDKRYINYNLYNKFENTERFYCIPSIVDVNSPNRLKLHIAEGPFDILSIYLNCRNKEKGIYTSITGANYLGIIYHYISTFKLPYIEIHLYPDNDKSGSDYIMKKIHENLYPLDIPIYIHRNMFPNQKDFGVKKDLINEKIYPL